MLLVCFVVLGWVGPHQAVSDSQRKSDGFIHAEPFLTLPKFPITFPSFSPSVKWDDKCPGAKVKHTHSPMSGWAGREEERSQGHGIRGVRPAGGVQAWLWGLRGACKERPEARVGGTHRRQGSPH